MNQETIEQVSLIAARAAIEHLEKEKKQQSKSKRDRRLRNTKLLLKHYRSMKEHCDDSPQYLETSDVESLTTDVDAEYLAINSITRSKKRTQQMVKFIDRMLEIYKINCEQSDNSIHLRQYKTIHSLYISEQVLSVDEISVSTKVDSRTVYRDVKEAVYSLSCLIFGIDGIRMID